MPNSPVTTDLQTFRYHPIGIYAVRIYKAAQVGEPRLGRWYREPATKRLGEKCIVG